MRYDNHKAFAFYVSKKDYKSFKKKGHKLKPFIDNILGFLGPNESLEVYMTDYEKILSKKKDRHRCIVHLTEGAMGILKGLCETNKVAERVMLSHLFKKWKDCTTK